MKHARTSALLLALAVLSSCKKDKEDKPALYPATAEIEYSETRNTEPLGLIKMINGQLYIPARINDINTGDKYYGGILLDDSKTAPSLEASKSIFLSGSGKYTGNTAFNPMNGELRFFTSDSLPGFTRFTIGTTQAMGGVGLFGTWNESSGWSITNALSVGNLVVGIGAVDSLGEPNFGVYAFNNFGTPAWNVRRGGSGADRATAAIELCDETIGVAGVTESFGNGSSDIWYMRLTQLGQVLNSVYIGQQGEDEATCMVYGPQCRVYIGGRTKNLSASHYDALLVCVDKEGNELWRKTYGDPDKDESFESLTMNLGFNGILAAGSVKYANLISKDAEVRGIDTDGGQLWVKKYHKEGSSITPRGIVAADKHFYVMCSSVNNNRVRGYFIKDLMP